MQQGENSYEHHAVAILEEDTALQLPRKFSKDCLIFAAMGRAFIVKMTSKAILQGGFKVSCVEILEQHG